MEKEDRKDRAREREMICHHKLISSPVAPVVYTILEEDESKPQGVAFLHPP